ncbi:MAG: response regulator transcription factor [Firmicutes bacterium]|nr:response regulator transcription factor [Bacillota bacterium]
MPARPEPPPVPGPAGSGDTGGRRIRVLLADDHAVVRGGLRMFLATHPDIEVAGETADAAQAVDLAERLQPDVVLLDLVMPPGPSAEVVQAPPDAPPGISVIRRLRQRAPGVRCLVLTGFSEEEKVLPALEAGAAGYLLKDVTPEELIRAIRSVAAGQVYLSAGVTGAVVRRATRAAREPASPLEALTPREREVLRLIAQGMSNAEIAGRLYVTEATVKSHVTRILQKLGVADRTQAALLAVRQGL